MKRIFKYSIISALLSPISSFAFDGFGEYGAAIKFGSTGYGFELTTDITKEINLRGGINAWSKKISDTKDGIEYDIEADLNNASLLADWHPFSNGFRLSAGIFINNSEISLDSSDATTYTINGVEYTAAEAGSISGKIDFNTVAPYLGIGWGNALNKKSDINISADLGIGFIGSPKVDISANGSLANDSDFMSDLDAEEDSIQDDVDDLNIFPVLTIGVSYKF
ncbi:MAG: hypothetical protein D6B27_12240 [Gammaproteobacteria bacterium]|nr:MAG: hypothetical protein D6B27_12240 [Gammaproteobacteria bacterium]